MPSLFEEEDGEIAPDTYAEKSKHSVMMRNKILVPQFYKKQFDRYELMDGPEHRREQRRGIDSIGWRGEKQITFDEKIVEWPGYPYTAFALEDISNTITGADGWMRWGMARWLLYCFSNHNDTALSCYAIDFPALKAWFWEKLREDPDAFPVSRSREWNRTQVRIVDIDLVRSAVSTKCFVLAEPDVALANISEHQR